MRLLIEYDRPSGSLIQIQTFAAEDSETANQTRLALELDRLHTTSTREIVILDAESEAVLRITHGRYFESLATLANPDRALGVLRTASLLLENRPRPLYWTDHKKVRISLYRFTRALIPCSSQRRLYFRGG